MDGLFVADSFLRYVWPLLMGFEYWYKYDVLVLFVWLCRFFSRFLICFYIYLSLLDHGFNFNVRLIDT